MAYKKLLTPEQRIEYVSEHDPDKSNPTVFKLKSLKASKKVELSMYLINERVEVDKNNLFPYFIAICKEGIDGVENLTDYQWKGYVDDELVQILSETHLFIEIGKKILELSSMDSELKKN